MTISGVFHGFSPRRLALCTALSAAMAMAGVSGDAAGFVAGEGGGTPTTTTIDISACTGLYADIVQAWNWGFVVHAPDQEALRMVTQDRFDGVSGSEAVELALGRYKTCAADTGVWTPGGATNYGCEVTSGEPLVTFVWTTPAIGRGVDPLKGTLTFQDLPPGEYPVAFNCWTSPYFLSVGWTASVRTEHSLVVKVVSPSPETTTTEVSETTEDLGGPIDTTTTLDSTTTEPDVTVVAMATSTTQNRGAGVVLPTSSLPGGGALPLTPDSLPTTGGSALGFTLVGLLFLLAGSAIHAARRKQTV
jgi:LPXTG-motif cell wall-anchored protein